MWAGPSIATWFLCVNEKKVLPPPGGPSPMPGTVAWQQSLNCISTPFSPSARCPHAGYTLWGVGSRSESRCDLSGLNIGTYKGSPHRGSCPPHSRLGAHQCMAICRELQLRTQPLAPPLAMLCNVCNVCIPSLEASTGEDGAQRPLHLPLPSLPMAPGP